MCEESKSVTLLGVTLTEGEFTNLCLYFLKKQQEKEQSNQPIKDEASIPSD